MRSNASASAAKISCCRPPRSDSDATSTCAYKGVATYFSLRDGDDETTDLAWTYVEPLHEAEQVRGHLCFYAERTDLSVDGVDVPRPDTLWRSRRSAEMT